MEALEQQALEARSALIKINGRDAATLAMLATDEFRFAYHADYLQAENDPVSLRLPLRKEPYLSDQLHPFFDNLLFEGEQLRVVEKKYNLNRRSSVDRFKLLMLTGQNTLSAVSVFPLHQGQPIRLDPKAERLAKVQLYPLLPAYVGSCSICLKDSPKGEHDACKKALWASQKPIHMEAFPEDPINVFRTFIPGQSISGAQRKALFYLDKTKTLKRQGFPQYIIKPEGEFPEMPANEHLTMSIAKDLGFPVPPMGLYQVPDIGLIFVIKRFDWTSLEGFQPIEDMAQLNEELAERKDQGTLEAVAKSIVAYTQSPAIELAEFFRRVLFAFVTGNGDMHLKNWSLYREPKSGFQKLAPLYDHLNVRASFPQEQVESVLSLNGKQKDLQRRDFEVFGLSIGVRDRYIQACFEQLPKWRQVIEAYRVRSRLTEKLRERYGAIVEQRMQRLK